jgi:hypothetical protein
MDKVKEYLRRAAECRDMARTASPLHYGHFEKMAQSWEQLAEDRKRQIEKLHQDSPALVVEFELLADDEKTKQ